MRSRLGVFLVLAVVAVTVTALAIVQLSAPPTAPVSSAAASRPASLPPEQQADAPPTTVYPGPLAPVGVEEPTAHKAQSKVWFHADSWWAVMAEPASEAFTIHRLDPASQQWQDTGAFVDERRTANPDVLWDGERLVVASAVDGRGRSAAARISRYHYVPDTQTFEIDPDFPVEITDRGVEGMVVDRDAKGTLWVGYTQEGKVLVNHAVDASDAIWAEPEEAPAPAGVVAPDDIAALVPVGDGIGVVWSNQLQDAVYFSTHSLDGSWGPTEVAVQGLQLADDHLNVKTTRDGTILVATKTSQDESENRNPQAPQTLLLQRHPGGLWETHQFGRVEDRHTRPVVLVDDAADRVYVFAASPATGGTVYAKWSSLREIGFPSGRGVPVIASETGEVYSDPTTTKDSVMTEDGFVVLAFDRREGRYVHALVGGEGHPDPAERPEPSARPALSAVVINDTFEPFTPGEGVRNGWALRRTDVGALEVVEDAQHGHGHVARATGTGMQDVRACKPFPHIGGGTIVAEVSVNVERPGLSDTIALAVRGAGDAASVRFGQGGTFVWYDGEEKIRSEVAFRPGAWYRVRATIDVDGATYDLAIVDEAADRTIVALEGLRWRAVSSEALEEVCVETAAEAADTALRFDDVRVAFLR